MVSCCTPEREVGVRNLHPHYSPKVLVIPRKRWLRPDMTEKMLSVALSLNTNKQNKTSHLHALSYICTLSALCVHHGTTVKQENCISLRQSNFIWGTIGIGDRLKTDFSVVV